MHDLARIDFARRLSAHEPGDGPPDASLGHAAVAALLAPVGGELSVLLMQRVEQLGDRWSGQICLPGGGAEPGDLDLLHTARRETLEELGVDLDAVARCLCRLERVPAVAAGGRLPLEITPFVFAATGDVQVVLGAEAAGAFWLPLAPALRGELDDRYHWRQGDRERVLPCWRWQSHVVWGLTHRMLVRLLELLARDPPR